MAVPLNAHASIVQDHMYMKYIPQTCEYCHGTGIQYMCTCTCSPPLSPYMYMNIHFGLIAKHVYYEYIHPIVMGLEYSIDVHVHVVKAVLVYDSLAQVQSEGRGCGA